MTVDANMHGTGLSLCTWQGTAALLELISMPGLQVTEADALAALRQPWSENKREVL